MQFVSRFCRFCTFTCAFGCEAYLLISACVDRFPLSTKREICLSHDRRGLPSTLPRSRLSLTWKHPARWLAFLSAGCAFIHTLTHRNYISFAWKNKLLTNSHSERWNGSVSVSRSATSTSVSGAYSSLAPVQLKELQSEKKTPGWWLDLESWVCFFLIAEHQLLACLSLTLCSLLRWFCLFTLVKSDHLSSPIYKLLIDPVTPYRMFKSKPGLLGLILSDWHTHLNDTLIYYLSAVIYWI